MYIRHVYAKGGLKYVNISLCLPVVITRSTANGMRQPQTEYYLHGECHVITNSVLIILQIGKGTDGD